uniref:Uncharacterized protein n=1 Tax=Schistocephalus solidus TaxID=70667 RepID=A0A0X3Q1L4_SCHSO
MIACRLRYRCPLLSNADPRPHIYRRRRSYRFPPLSVTIPTAFAHSAVLPTGNPTDVRGYSPSSNGKYLHAYITIRTFLIYFYRISFCTLRSCVRRAGYQLSSTHPKCKQL